MSSQYLMGMDPAQLRDWSALVVTRRTWNAEKKANFYQIEAMDRKQHMPYNDIVNWTISVFRDPRFSPNAEESARALSLGFQPQLDMAPELILDSTGIGRALWDLFRAQGVRVVGATITAGSSLGDEGGVYHLGKLLLLGRFLAAWDAGRVQGNPNHPRWPILERELANYRIEFTKSGAATFNAPPGEHDDLLFAAALSIWWGEEARKY